MKTNVYIDGFNFYYGCLKGKGKGLRWLNLSALCALALPKDQINKIKYFTARIKSRPNDPDKSVRQQTYLRALATIPNISVIEGHYLEHPRRAPLITPLPDGTRFVDVTFTEEKGSDVNLAAHLLHDGHLGDYELAVVMSNDSDLVEPIKLVIQDLGLQVGVLNPHIDRKNPSVQLQQTATFFKYIRKTDLQASQFPNEMTDAKGKFYKPPKW
ncbi:MAG TPA: NYN domain-containing protein [Phototrophicaceae bacterium]|nr:NYN domain-containing protein [Phototrophicaceae bacterium]